MVIKVILLVVFFAVMVAVGIYARRHATSVDGFVLGGRSVGPWLTAFAYGTSYFSAVVFVGYAGQFGWKYGIASTWIGIGNAVIGSLLAWVVLGRRTKIMTQHLGSKTMPDFFGQRYSSKALKIAASVIVFVFLIPYTASVYNGLSRLFEMAFNIPYTWCVIAMAVFTALYVILGGYMATAINDFIQGIIMLIGIVAVIAAVLNGQGGFMNAISEMSQIPERRGGHRGTAGSVYIFLRAGSAQSARRRHTDVSRNMGTAPDDREVLCDKRREIHQYRNCHLHIVRSCRLRRMLFPRRLRKAL